MARSIRRFFNKSNSKQGTQDEQGTENPYLDEIIRLAKASTDISKGMVGAKLPKDLSPELQEIADNFTSMIYTTSTVVKDIDEMSEKSAKTSRELEEITTSTSRVMTDLSATLEELTSTTVQLNSSVTEISTGTGEIFALTKDGMSHLSLLETKMKQIQHDSQEANKRINALDKATGKMDNILNVITGISRQTNLLALNAAIEAARAGESGKGFAVVADEVRKLAGMTQLSLDEIKGLITKINSETVEAVKMINANSTEVSEGSLVLDETTKSFKIIEERITSIVNQVKESAQATQQIASGSQEIASAAVMQSESINSIHSLSSNLAAMSNNMKDILAGVQIGSGELELDLAEFDKEYNRISASQQEYLKKEFGVKGKLVIGMVARLEENKGHDFFLKSLGAVLDKNENVRVLIAGNGSLEHQLRDKISKMGLSKKVQLLGYRSDSQAILSICDIIVGTSIKEGSPPSIILEAMAAAKPIVSTDVVGSKAVLKHEHDGLLVKYGDTKALSDAINKYIENPEIRKKMAEEARLYIEKLYNRQ
jgi:methyl-accepting chemotaxis protein